MWTLKNFNRLDKLQKNWESEGCRKTTKQKLKKFTFFQINRKRENKVDRKYHIWHFNNLIQTTRRRLPMKQKRLNLKKNTTLMRRGSSACGTSVIFFFAKFCFLSRCRLDICYFVFVHCFTWLVTWHWTCTLPFNISDHLWVLNLKTQTEFKLHSMTQWSEKIPSIQMSAHNNW